MRIYHNYHVPDKRVFHCTLFTLSILTPQLLTILVLKFEQEAHGPQRSPEIPAPRGLIGRIYVRDHYTLLHTKYISSGPHGFREDFFKFFPL